MSDMYGKLGDLLNNVLTSGEVPQDNISRSQDPFKNKAKRENPDSFFLTNNTKQVQDQNKKQVSPKSLKQEKKFVQGKILKKEDIKLQKTTHYTYNVLNKQEFLPKEVSKSLYILDIACIENFTIQNLKEQYRKLLKSNHPDTKDEYSKINYTVDELKNAYKIVKDYIIKNYTRIK